jgi:hypothetical protein
LWQAAFYFPFVAYKRHIKMNVTEVALNSYIKLFHQTIKETADQFLPQEHKSSLLHLSLLPARVVGYVSTQFGVAIEYTPSAQTEIHIVRGSARVEDLLVQAPLHFRNLKPMFNVQEGGAGGKASSSISRLTIEGTFPFRLAGPNANLSVGEIAFKIGGWRREIEYAELFGNRTADFWSPEHAVARAKDEVLAALVQTKRADEKHLSLVDYIGKFKERTVLLLGDYDDAGLQRLARISEVVVAHGYEAILIKDIPDQPVQDLPQKVATIGSLARFVIVDDSSKSGHLMEVQLCKQNNWITILLRQNGEGGSWMTAGASILSNVIFEQSYNEEDYSVAVSTVIKWAEQKITELQRQFDGLYPWRMRT